MTRSSGVFLYVISLYKCELKKNVSSPKRHYIKSLARTSPPLHLMKSNLSSWVCPMAASSKGPSPSPHITMTVSKVRLLYPGITSKRSALFICEKRVAFGSVLTFGDLLLFWSHLLVSTSSSPVLPPVQYPGTWMDGKPNRTDMQQLRWGQKHLDLLFGSEQSGQ